MLCVDLNNLFNHLIILSSLYILLYMSIYPIKKATIVNMWINIEVKVTLKTYKQTKRTWKGNLSMFFLYHHQSVLHMFLYIYLFHSRLMGWMFLWIDEYMTCWIQQHRREREHTSFFIRFCLSWCVSVCTNGIKFATSLY